MVSPFMWRQTGKCLVWLWTERVLRHIRDCLVSARRSLTMGPRAIDVLRSTKSFVHFVAECCARPCLHCHDKLGIYGAPRLWDPHRDGPGRGVLEKRSNISHLFWRRDLTRMRTSLCCGQRYLRPQNTDLTDSPPHKWGDHITHKVCWSTLHAGNPHIRFDERGVETEAWSG